LNILDIILKLSMDGLKKMNEIEDLSRTPEEILKDILSLNDHRAFRLIDEVVEDIIDSFNTAIKAENIKKKVRRRIVDTVQDYYDNQYS
jgi:division protein CdvB (Snf7/Vps24/ESCRT-III family)